MRLGKLNEGATGDFGQQFFPGLARNRGQIQMLSRLKAPRLGSWSTVPRMVPTKLGPAAEKHEEPREYQQTNK